MIESVSLSCPTCHGRGCRECNQTGTFTITRCPFSDLTPETVELLSVARDARNGAWPVAGGTLDQTPACRDGVRLVESLRASHLADLATEGGRSSD